MARIVVNALYGLVSEQIIYFRQFHYAIVASPWGTIN